MVGEMKYADSNFSNPGKLIVRLFSSTLAAAEEYLELPGTVVFLAAELMPAALHQGTEALFKIHA